MTTKHRTTAKLPAQDGNATTTQLIYYEARLEFEVDNEDDQKLVQALRGTGDRLAALLELLQQRGAVILEVLRNGSGDFHDLNEQMHVVGVIKTAPTYKGRGRGATRLPRPR
jgi:hypothetical protein